MTFGTIVPTPLERFAAAALGPAALRPTHFPLDALPVSADSLPPSCDIANSPLDIFRLLIAAKIADIHGHDTVSVNSAFDAIESPRDETLADFAIPVPRLRIKSNLTPAALASETAAAFHCNDFITSASSVGAFLNFRINHTLLRVITLSLIVSKGSLYGHNASGVGKVAALDMSSPNIAKPFHAGHLRSTIIGNFIRNVLVANGWKTVAINYLGDWGKQYGLLAVGYMRHGNDEKLNEDPINHLYEIYVKVNAEAEADAQVHDEARAYFRRMEEGDESALALWRKFRELSIAALDKTYRRLGIEFDSFSGESQVTNINDIMEKLATAKLLEDSDGAVVVDLTKPEKLGKVIVQKRDGTKLYLTRDIGAVYQRFSKYAFDEMIYVVASPQDLHFKQLFATLRRLDAPFVGGCKHVSFGMVKGMSTRKGTVVFLDDMLETAKAKMLAVMKLNEKKFAQIEDPENVADVIGMSAIIVQDLSARRIKDYEFNWDHMLSFEGDTGPYLQYAHARLCSIERAAGPELALNEALLRSADIVGVFNNYVCAKGPASATADADADAESAAAAATIANTSAARALIDRLVFQLARYPALVRGIPASGGYEPCTIVTYLFQLCHTVSSLYELVRALDSDPEVRRACVLLYSCTRQTLANGLQLLGLKPVSKM